MRIHSNQEQGCASTIVALFKQILRAIVNNAATSIKRIDDLV